MPNGLDLTLTEIYRRLAECDRQNAKLGKIVKEQQKQLDEYERKMGEMENTINNLKVDIGRLEADKGDLKSKGDSAIAFNQEFQQTSCQQQIEESLLRSYDRRKIESELEMLVNRKWDKMDAVMLEFEQRMEVKETLFNFALRNNDQEDSPLRNIRSANPTQKLRASDLKVPRRLEEITHDFKNVLVLHESLAEPPSRSAKKVSIGRGVIGRSVDTWPVYDPPARTDSEDSIDKNGDDVVTLMGHDADGWPQYAACSTSQARVHLNHNADQAGTYGSGIREIFPNDTDLYNILDTADGKPALWEGAGI